MEAKQMQIIDRLNIHINDEFDYIFCLFYIHSILVYQNKQFPKFDMPANKKSVTSKRLNKKIGKIQESAINKNECQPNIVGKLSYNLNHIIEVTEEHDTQRFNTQTIQQVSNLLKKKQVSLWKRSLDCLKNIIPCFAKQAEFSIVVKEEELLKTIEKLRNTNIKCKPLLPPLESNKKTLVLDIDQNLVYSSQTQLDKYDFTFRMKYKKSDIKVYTKIRFGLESFLFEMSKYYEVIIYTTNLEEYVEQVLKEIDKKKRISAVLLKEKCLNINKVHFLKSLKVLGRNPQNVVFIDHNLASGLLQPKNFLQLRCYSGEKHDRQLIKIIPFLRELAEKESVMPVGKQYEEYCNREIRLKFNSIDQNKSKNQSEQCSDDKENDYQQRRRQYSKIINGKQKKYGHRKMNSEVQSLANKQQGTKQQKQRSEEEQSSTNQSQTGLRARNINFQQSV